MKINQKIIMGFLVVALLILAVSYISVTTQENVVKRYRKVAGEVLPGTIAAVELEAELQHILDRMEKYGSSGDIKDRENTEAALSAMQEHMATHRLYHSGHDAPGDIKIIDEKIETITSFVLEYILLKDKGESREELDIVFAKIDRTVNGFMFWLEPRIKEHLKGARKTIRATEQNVARTQKFILGSSAVIFFLALVWGFFISRLILKPIKELSEAASRIGKGQLDIQIEPTSKDEIGHLAIAFSKMVKDLQKITVSRDAFAQEVAERKKVEKALQIAYDQSIIYAKQLKEQIAERTLAEESLRESEHKYRTITGAAQDAILMMDNEGNISYWNPAAERMFGYRPEEVIGRELHVVIGPQRYLEDYKKGFKRFKETGQGVGVRKTLELAAIRKDGTEFPIELSISAIQIKDKWHATGILRDITDRKQAEEAKEKLETQLLQAQKMEAVGTLAGGIAHDFNNILQVVSGYVQLLLMKKEVKDTNRLYLNYINESALKAAELTKQLLIFSRKVESKLRTVDLNQEIKDVHKLFQRTIPKMIAIELHLAENLKLINADPVQLEQIMMNLGVNARDAMPDGGKLTFETKNVILDEACCKTHVDVVPGKYVLLRISDTGHGMDVKTLQHIFDPFYTTKETGKGTGLGLAIVYGLVESHGGHIMCYSEPGHGTIFNIHFPALSMGEPEQKQELEKEAVIRGDHETVLIVDDEEALRNQGRDMLAKYGYTAITAENGEKAIEVYKKENDRIDLVILDIGMPGMGGYKCLKQLIEIDPEIKVIVASGYATGVKAEELLKSGAAGFIDKPYRLTDMLKKAREVLDHL